MASRLCFVCSQQIQGYFEFPSKRQTAGGTLCQLLKLPLTDNTFGFGPKFLQALYCSECVNKLKDLHKMLTDLKELERKIEAGRKHMEDQLQKSCDRRNSKKSIADEEDDDDEDDPLHCLALFRKDVVKEINALRSPWSTFVPASDNQLIIKNVISKGNVVQSGKMVASTPRSQRIAKKPEPETRSRPQRIRSEPVRYKQIHSSRTKEEPDTTGTENADYQDDEMESNMDHNLSDNDPDPLSEALFSIIGRSEEVQVEVDVDQQHYDDLDDCPSDTEEIFVEPAADGSFQCPYAPACGLSFSETRTEEFAAHIRLVHNTSRKKTKARQAHESLGLGPTAFVTARKRSDDVSSVWYYFLKAVNGQEAKCKDVECQKILKTQRGSTSGLRKHLSAIHKIDLSKISCPSKADPDPERDEAAAGGPPPPKSMKTDPDF